MQQPPQVQCTTTSYDNVTWPPHQIFSSYLTRSSRVEEPSFYLFFFWSYIECSLLLLENATSALWVQNNLAFCKLNKSSSGVHYITATPLAALFWSARGYTVDLVHLEITVSWIILNSVYLRYSLFYRKVSSIMWHVFKKIYTLGRCTFTRFDDKVPRNYFSKEMFHQQIYFANSKCFIQKNKTKKEDNINKRLINVFHEWRKLEFSPKYFASFQMYIHNKK